MIPAERLRTLDLTHFISSTMNPTTHTTEHPIVLKIVSHDQAATYEVLTKTVRLDIDKAKHALEIRIDGKSVSDHV